MKNKNKCDFSHILITASTSLARKCTKNFHSSIFKAPNFGLNRHSTHARLSYMITWRALFTHVWCGQSERIISLYILCGMENGTFLVSCPKLIGRYAIASSLYAVGNRVETSFQMMFVQNEARVIIIIVYLYITSKYIPLNSWK